MAALSARVPAQDPLVEWGVSAAALPGQTESGDLFTVQPSAEGVLLAVVDGLGHGDEAGAAAKVAIAALEGAAHEPIAAMVARCDDEARKTRGVAMTIAWLGTQERTLTWLGVGNVAGVVIRADDSAHETLVTRGGIVGFRLPPLHPVTLPIAAGDTLILATDGVRSSFAEGLSARRSPQAVAQEVLEQHWKHTDDALVLVARYLGTGE